MAPRSSSVVKERQRRAQAEVVGDRQYAVDLGDRRVEVDAHQDALAREAPPALDASAAARHASDPMWRVRSTRRFE